MAYYNIEDFVNACDSHKNDVILIGNVNNDARNDFNLSTKSELLDFISNNGLEDLTFINSKKWDKNPNKSNEIIVDAYEFKSMYKLGYIAIMYNDVTKKWIIKSFHLSENRNRIFEEAFKKAGLIEEEEK